MAQPRWDEQEVALLLDAYLRIEAGSSQKTVAEGLNLFAGLCNLPNRHARLPLDAACTDGNELMPGFQNHAAARRAVIGNAGATVEH